MAAPRTASHAHHVKEGAAFVYDKLSRRQMTPYEITELHDADLVNHVDEATGKSPLHLVAKRDQRKHALALIEAGADPHVTDNSGGTPLHEAATWGSEAVAKALVFGGAVLDAVNEDGMTPVELALSFNEDTVAKAIEQFAEEKRLEDEERRRMVTAEGAALMNAVKASTDVEASIAGLSEYSLNYQSDWAAANGNVDTMGQLLDAGIKVDAVDRYKATALHWAAYYGRTNCCALLVQRAPKITPLKNADGRTYLDELRRKGYGSDAMVLESGDAIGIEAMIWGGGAGGAATPAASAVGPHTDASGQEHGGQQYGNYEYEQAAEYGPYDEQGYTATELQPYPDPYAESGAWETQWDDAAQSWYYYNPSTGETSWVDPSPAGY